MGPRLPPTYIMADGEAHRRRRHAPRVRIIREDGGQQRERAPRRLGGTTMAEERLAAILGCYEGRPHELIPVLQDVQQAFGYLPEPEMRDIARFLGLPDSRVYAVATFYEQFRFTPPGRNKIVVCRGTACHVRGAQRIREELERRLGIKTSETTEDLEYTLETAACIGCCGLAPAVVINETTYGRLTPAKIGRILDEREGANQ